MRHKSLKCCKIMLLEQFKTILDQLRENNSPAHVCESFLTQLKDELCWNPECVSYLRDWLQKPECRIERQRDATIKTNLMKMLSDLISCDIEVKPCLQSLVRDHLTHGSTMCLLSNTDFEQYHLMVFIELHDTLLKNKAVSYIQETGSWKALLDFLPCAVRFDCRQQTLIGFVKRVFTSCDDIAFLRDILHHIVVQYNLRVSCGDSGTEFRINTYIALTEIMSSWLSWEPHIWPLDRVLCDYCCIYVNELQPEFLYNDKMLDQVVLKYMVCSKFTQYRYELSHNPFPFENILCYMLRMMEYVVNIDRLNYVVLICSHSVNYIRLLMREEIVDRNIGHYYTDYYFFLMLLPVTHMSSDCITDDNHIPNASEAFIKRRRSFLKAYEEKYMLKDVQSRAELCNNCLKNFSTIALKGFRHETNMFLAQVFDTLFEEFDSYALYIPTCVQYFIRAFTKLIPVIESHPINHSYYEAQIKRLLSMARKRRVFQNRIGVGFLAGICEDRDADLFYSDVSIFMQTLLTTVAILEVQLEEGTIDQIEKFIIDDLSRQNFISSGLNILCAAVKSQRILSVWEQKGICDRIFELMLPLTTHSSDDIRCDIFAAFGTIMSDTIFCRAHIQSREFMERILTCLRLEQEGRVRTNVVTLVRLVVQRKDIVNGFPEDVRHDLYYTMFKTTLSDLHWEVVVECVRFWESIIVEAYNELFDSDIRLMFQFLAECGCLEALLKASAENEEHIIFEVTMRVIARLKLMLNEIPHVQELYPNTKFFDKPIVADEGAGLFSVDEFIKRVAVINPDDEIEKRKQWSRDMVSAFFENPGDPASDDINVMDCHG